MKTNQLTGHALDWAVLKASNKAIGQPDHLPFNVEWLLMRDAGDFQYSTNWAQGGPIIERENIALSPMPDGLCRAYAADGTRWAPNGDEVFNWKHKQQGYHPLIAAMRCYVASKFGNEVEIPKELEE